MMQELGATESLNENLVGKSSEITLWKATEYFTCERFFSCCFLETID